MSALALTAIRNVVTTALAGWRVQAGRLNIEAGAETDRFALIRPVGGAPAELVRRSQFTVALAGQKDEPVPAVHAFADTLVQALQLRTGVAGATLLQASEPVYLPTNDGRPVFEIAVSAITQ